MGLLQAVAREGIFTLQANPAQDTALPREGEPGMSRGTSFLGPHLCRRPSSSRGSPGVGICAPLVPDADGNLSGGRAGESHTGLESQHRGELPRSPPGGLETSLQAFQETCVLFFSFFFFFFFFFSFHYHSHSGESKHKQTNLTTTGADGEGKATSMYICSAAPVDRQHCFQLGRGEPFPSGRVP